MKGKKSANINFDGLTIPNWSLLKLESKQYKRELYAALWYLHYGMDSKILAKSFRQYCTKTFGEEAKMLSNVPDHYLETHGKYTYIIGKGGELDEWTVSHIENHYKLLKAQFLNNEETEDDKVAVKSTNVISIKERMLEQVSPLIEKFELVLDIWSDGNFDINKFDPNNMLQSFEPKLKPAHAKLIRDWFTEETQYLEEILQFTDPDIREAYSHTTAKTRKQLKQLFDKTITALDAMISVGKAQRVSKTRKPKQISKEKLVSKLKCQESDPITGLASVNLTTLVDSQKVWVYNTKYRKLGYFVADEMTGPIRVKGTSLVGFDESKSFQKTVRKPEVLMGANKLSTTKIDKLYKELNSKESVLKGRFGENTVVFSVF